MAKSSSAMKIKINSYDDLFGNPLQSDETKVQEIPLDQLYEFHLHPFKVLDDEKMQETVESIKNYGVLTPGIARPRENGGYEIIAGHRRKRGCELAGLSNMPMIVKDYSDDEAVIIMVDTNIQRESLLPSEKAKAYAMKYEAMKHQGKKGNGNTLDEVGEVAGESGKTVQRYIWLSRLSEALLDFVDEKRIGFVQGVDLSFLNEEQQVWVEEEFLTSNSSMTTVQSAKLKEYGKSGELTQAMARLILEEEKPKEQRLVIKADKFKEYFSGYTVEEAESILAELLEEWKKRQNYNTSGHNV